MHFNSKPGPVSFLSFTHHAFLFHLYSPSTPWNELLSQLTLKLYILHLPLLANAILEVEQCLAFHHLLQIPILPKSRYQFLGFWVHQDWNYFLRGLLQHVVPWS